MAELSGEQKKFENPISAGQVTALLDHGASFEGRLSFEGTVRIGGQFSGEVFTNDTLVINPGAKVEAQIEAETVVISGLVKGNIFARRRVIMYPPAIFKGTVTTPSLKIEEGVVFEEPLICLRAKVLDPSAKGLIA